MPVKITASELAARCQVFYHKSTDIFLQYRKGKQITHRAKRGKKDKKKQTGISSFIAEGRQAILNNIKNGKNL